MKKLLCILLMLLMTLPALAQEENPFAPYAFTLPEGAALEEHEGTYTVVSGMTRVVVMMIPRVPDADPAEAIIRMMTQFEPQAVIGEDIPLTDGFIGLTALNTDKFGEGVDQTTVMILCAHGDLLILSGYDLTGDGEAVGALLDALLTGLTADGVNIYTKDKE